MRWEGNGCQEGTTRAAPLPVQVTWPISAIGSSQKQHEGELVYLPLFGRNTQWRWTNESSNCLSCINTAIVPHLASQAAQGFFAPWRDATPSVGAANCPHKQHPANKQ